MRAEKRPKTAGVREGKARDLRSHLDWVAREFPGDVIRVEKEVNAKFEVTALLLKLHRFKLENLPILIFNRVRTVQGRISPFPLVVLLSAGPAHMGKFLGVHPEEVVTVLSERLKQRVPIVRVSQAEAPCREVVKIGPKINLWEFPALQAWNLDPGPYVNAGGFLCYDPETGVDNSAIIRGWLKDRKTIPWYANKQGHTMRIYSLYERRGEAMRAAFWVGHHPAAMKGSSTRIPYGDSHMEAMGALLGEPVRMVASETWGEEFLLPADAEVVIEGIVPPNRRSPEGPYGEDWGHTGAQRLVPFMEVTAVTHRRDALWVNFVTGQAPFLEDRREGNYRAITAFRVARSVSPAVLSVRPSKIKGGYWVKIRKTREGEPMDIGMAVLSSVEGAKFAFVVDEDVNIDDEEEALWALGSRTQWNDDVVVIPRGRASGTDPSIPTDGMSAKALIDATKPFPFEPKNSVPREVLDRVRLSDYLPADFFDSLPTRLLNNLPSDVVREIRSHEVKGRQSTQKRVKK